MSFFISIAVLFAILIPFSSVARAENAEEFELRAAAAVLYEKNSGQILYDKNAAEPLHPGSLANLMTVLLAVEAVGRGELRLHQTITVSQEVRSRLGSASANYDVGEHVRLSDMLYAAYIGVESEACYIIAEAVGGSVEEFVALMNARAKALGCGDTLYADPAGEGSGEQYTTARDQVVIFRAAAENALFLNIAQTTSHRTAATERSPERTIVNANLALRPESEYYYPGLYAGMPDGPSSSAGSFVSAAQVGGMHFFAAVIGAEQVERRGQAPLMESYTETVRLYEWAASTFAWRNVTMEHRVVATMPVDYGLGRDKVDLSPAETVRLLLPNAVTDADIKYAVFLHGRENGEAITAPVTRGEILGGMTISIPGQPEVKVPLVAEQNIQMDRKTFFKAELKRALTNKWVLIGIVVLAIIMGTYTYIVVMYRRTQYENTIRRRESLRRYYEERQEEQDTTRLPRQPAQIALHRDASPEESGGGAEPPEKPQRVFNGSAEPPEKPQRVFNGGAEPPEKSQRAFNGGAEPFEKPRKTLSSGALKPIASPQDALSEVQELTDEEIIRLASLSKDDLLAELDALIETDSVEF
ncbi:MAG TPA: D-alanyl-D-alanine carboxypeptidase [Papillibacter sp.]|nr:D-alanyl-D-alanine carboxypeptidase [Papillibacter sp.]